MTKPIEVRNPRTGKFDYVIIPPPPRLLAQQCKRSRRAQVSWQKLGLEGRIRSFTAVEGSDSIRARSLNGSSGK